MQKIFEYHCEECGETFVGDGEKQEQHGAKENGELCGGMGELAYTYTAR